VPASECPCPACIKVMRAARAIARHRNAMMSALLLQFLVPIKEIDT